MVTLTFLSLAAVGTFAVLRSGSSEREVRSVTEGVVPSATQSVAMMAQLKDVHIATLAMVAAEDEQAAAQAHKALGERKAELVRVLQDQLASADSKTQKGLVEVAQEGLQNYFSAIDDTAKFKLAGQNELAAATMAATVDQYLREQGEVMQALQVEKTRSKDAAIAKLNEMLAGTKLMLGAITAGALLLMGAAGLLLYRQVVLPVGAMERKMTEIATHQDFSQRMPVSRMDEIGRSVVAFNTMIERIQESSALVRQKTADIHSMLHAIPQGILTIEAGGRIHPEYSEHLREILEGDGFAGHDVMKVLFEGSGLGADALAQVDAALAACIGEDTMNFEFNAHLLPSEISKTTPGGASKVLDLHWSAMDDGNGQTSRLLLCLRDVTELRALARAAQAQGRELALIGEILAVQQEKFDDFIESATGFMVQNTRLLQPLGEADGPARSEALAQLFRNMHTVKGNARTHGLLGLANVVHGVEDRYDRLRKGQEAWDQEVLLVELAQARSALDEYACISRDKLGRQGPGRRGAVDKYLMVPKEQVQRLLDRMAAGAGGDREGLARILSESRVALECIGTDRLEDALAPVLDGMPALAAELGKPVPVVTIHDQGLRVRTQLAGVLRNAFVHLLRNALDHGIEAPAIRRMAGKPEAGRIALSAGVDGDVLRITLADDGSGLRLDRILERARDQGLVASGEQPAPTALAQLIFKSGFSTATQVTSISGRGVGMDAVKAFIEAEGGRIALRLQGETRADGTVPMQLHIELPARLAVNPSESNPPLVQHA